MGLGTWAWGNQFLWGYEKDQDAELQEVFNLMVSKGVNVKWMEGRCAWEQTTTCPSARVPEALSNTGLLCWR